MTTPDLSPTGQKTDLGDLNLFDIVLTRSGGFELGLGPQLTLPTAGRDETGTGKWQAGLAALVVKPTPWDLHEGAHYIPIGAGVGRVWKLSAATCNFFVEPQWTVAHEGDGVPEFQMYAGLNLQFPW